MKTNLKNMAWMLAATLVMAACSDSLDESENTGQGPLTGEGYVRVAINLPSTSGTRAFDENNDLDDGDVSEWTVNNGIIAFFEGTQAGGEASATFRKAYNLGSLSANQFTDDPNQITAKLEAQIIEAPMLKDKDNNQMYALVILNPGSVASVNSGNLILENGNADITLTSTSTSNSTIAALNTVTVKWGLDVSVVTGNNGFLMLNSPLYDRTNSQTQTLVPVTVYPTEVEAGKYEAAEIYVERIVAKVDVIVGNGTEKSLTVQNTPGNIYVNDVVTFMEDPNNDKLGWTLNVTNKNTVPVRNVSDVSEWAKTSDGYVTNFIGNATIGSKWNRIYWAMDNNYDNTSSTDDFTIYDNNSTITWNGYTKVSSGTQTVDPLYCLENTAPYQFNNENNTTSVLIKAKYDFDPTDGSGDESFFIMDTNGTTLSETQFLEKIKNLIADASSYSLSINPDVPGGYYETAEELNSLIHGYTFDADDALIIGEVRYYKDGGCYYYTIPIKHFGQDYAAGTDKTQKKYEGRYGVVRNNWYQLTIESVSGPGRPEIDDPGSGHVDDDEGYIKCTINVLSWAKRSQGVDL